MRIEPKGKLEEILREHGMERFCAGFDVDDDRLERFKAEANAQAHWSEKEKQALAVYMALTHPGWGRAKVQREFALVDAVPFSEPPVAVLETPVATEVEVAPLPVTLPPEPEVVAPAPVVVEEIPQALPLPDAVAPVPEAPALDWPLWAWRWAVLALLALNAAGVFTR